MWTLYILKCKNNVFYTGITSNLSRRLVEHTDFKNRKYTSFNRPQEIVYSEVYSNRFEAEMREKQLKRWSKAKKVALINGDLNQLRELSKSRS